MRSNGLISTILAMTVFLGGVSQQARAQQLVSGTSKTDSSANAVSRVHSLTLLARMWRGRREGFSLMTPSRYGSVTAVAATSSLSAVLGNGTVGKISMWTGTGPSGNSILGDSIITQAGNNIGIGTDSPTSKLTVQGMIETTLGGYKFPDGTVQTTAGLTSIFHDETLTGGGTSVSPLRVAVPLSLIGATPFSVLTINNSNNLGSGFGGNGVESVGGSSNAGTGGSGIAAAGGRSDSGFAGEGVFAQGGFSADGISGTGVFARGGFSRTGRGGIGAQVFGGTSDSGESGVGVEATGGFSFNFDGAAGVKATGARSRRDSRGGPGIITQGGNNSESGFGGDGVIATGGDIEGIGVVGVLTRGGNGLTATGGSAQNDICQTCRGGHGVVATGGNRNGIGVVAIGGFGGGGSGGTANTESAGVFAIGGAAPTGVQTLPGTGVIAKGGPARGAGTISGHGLVVAPGDVEDGAILGHAAVINGRVFTGELHVSGDLTVLTGTFSVLSGTKNFKIDHPLDPENKYLVHASVESSEVLNIYSGNVTTNAQGEATVMLPEWFEALNRDLRYQLTVIGTFAQAMVAEKVKQNRFTIRTSAPNIEVSWQVTGVRSDRAMQKRPFKADEFKPENERGTYLDPEAFDKPEERGLEWARNPEMMRQRKESRVKQVESSKQKAQTNYR